LVDHLLEDVGAVRHYSQLQTFGWLEDSFDSVLALQILRRLGGDFPVLQHFEFVGEAVVLLGERLSAEALAGLGDSF
jgi:hypothetical protein